MSGRQEIKVIVKKGGETSIDVIEGPGGTACETDMIKPIADKLGGVSETSYKDEYYETVETNEYEHN